MTTPRSIRPPSKRLDPSDPSVIAARKALFPDSDPFKDFAPKHRVQQKDD